MFTRYRYMTLTHQDSLAESTGEPFAVIVETKRYLYYIGFEISGDETSVSGQVLRNFPEIVKERIVAASREAQRQKCHALDLLRREFAWNVRASKVSNKLAFGSIERFSHKIFSSKIERFCGAPCTKLHPLSNDHTHACNNAECSDKEEALPWQPATHCADCNLSYGGVADLNLPDEQWALIGGRSKVLCANCIMRRAGAVKGVVRVDARLVFDTTAPPSDGLTEETLAQIANRDLVYLSRPIGPYDDGAPFVRMTPQERDTLVAAARGRNMLREENSQMARMPAEPPEYAIRIAELERVNRAAFRSLTDVYTAHDGCDKGAHVTDILHIVHGVMSLLEPPPASGTKTEW